MDRILRGAPGWQEWLADAIARAPRPIAVDPRFMPRDGTGERARRPRWDRSTMPPAREASTLLLLHPAEDGSLVMPLTVRNAALRAHAGEVSLPGGAGEPGDADRAATALREAQEEIGLNPDVVTIVGALDDVWIPVTNFDIRPFVGVADERLDLVPQSDEVALIVELPLADLLAEGAISDEVVHGPGWTLRVGGYRAQGQLVWGATARTLAMLASVLTGAAS
ncbi:MAG TPA: CoA pyrophosphatase [Candidatus Limnocylindria bacterium]|jgi:8-oxo-dGTP pyrophosphatase MutT (NUDIX family)